MLAHPQQSTSNKQTHPQWIWQIRELMNGRAVQHPERLKDFNPFESQYYQHLNAQQKNVLRCVLSGEELQETDLDAVVIGMRDQSWKISGLVLLTMYHWGRKNNIIELLKQKTYYLYFMYLVAAKQGDIEFIKALASIQIIIEIKKSVVRSEVELQKLLPRMVFNYFALAIQSGSWPCVEYFLNLNPALLYTVVNVSGISYNNAAWAILHEQWHIFEMLLAYDQNQTCQSESLIHLLEYGCRDGFMKSCRGPLEILFQHWQDTANHRRALSIMLDTPTMTQGLAEHKHLAHHVLSVLPDETTLRQFISLGMPISQMTANRAIREYVLLGRIAEASCLPQSNSVLVTLGDVFELLLAASYQQGRWYLVIGKNSAALSEYDFQGIVAYITQQTSQENDPGERQWNKDAFVPFNYFTLASSREVAEMLPEYLNKLFDVYKEHNIEVTPSDISQLTAHFSHDYYSLLFTFYLSMQPSYSHHSIAAINWQIAIEYKNPYALVTLYHLFYRNQPGIVTLLEQRLIYAANQFNDLVRWGHYQECNDFINDLGCFSLTLKAIGQSREFLKDALQKMFANYRRCIDPIRRSDKTMRQAPLKWHLATIYDNAFSAMGYPNIFSSSYLEQLELDAKANAKLAVNRVEFSPFVLNFS